MAMEKSASFRREMIDLVRDLQQLPSALMTQEVARDGFVNSVVARLREAKANFGDFLRYLVSTPAGRVAAVTAVVVVVAIGVLQQRQPGESPLDLYTVISDIPSSELLSLTTRGLDSLAVSVASISPDSAAIAEIRRFVELDSNFMLIVKEDTLNGYLGRFVTLRLADSTGKELVNLHVPTSESLSDTAEVTLWIVGLSSGGKNQLFKADATREDMTVRWEKANGEKGVACVVYRTSSGYIASPGRAFTIPKPIY